MIITVEGGHNLYYSTEDKDTEVMTVSVSYLMPSSKKGYIFKLTPKKLKDVKVGDTLAFRVNRKRLLRGRLYMFCGQKPYRLKKVMRLDNSGGDWEEKLRIKTTSKYLTINKFLFKGVRPSEDIPKQSGVHRDKEPRRSKKNRKSVDVPNKRVRRKRRSTHAV